MTSMFIEMSAIERDQRLRGRFDTKTEHETALEYARVMTRAKELGKPNPFPAIGVMEKPDGTGVWLVWGWKRFEAHELNGETSIEAIIFKGDWDHAVELSVTAPDNLTAGVARTNADKRFAVQQVIGQWFERSDSWISDELCVSSALVSVVRAEEIKRREAANEPVPTTRTSKSGKVMEVGNIGNAETDTLKAHRKARATKAAMNKVPEPQKALVQELAERVAERTGTEVDASAINAAAEVAEEIAATGGMVSVNGESQPAATIIDPKELTAAEIATIEAKMERIQREYQYRNGGRDLPRIAIVVKPQDVVQDDKVIGISLGDGAAYIRANNDADGGLFDDMAKMMTDMPGGVLQLIYTPPAPEHPKTKPIVRPPKRVKEPTSSEAEKTTAKLNTRKNKIADKSSKAKKNDKPVKYVPLSESVSGDVNPVTGEELIPF